MSKGFKTVPSKTTADNKVILSGNVLIATVIKYFVN
jgi:hypothetical protein